MKTRLPTLCLAALVLLAAPLLGSSALDDLAMAPGLPQLPLLEMLSTDAGFGGPGPCTVIRPVATHDLCTYSLCESHGCGAPYDFDPISCSCYCGYMF
ncbi:MAG: hypothetical protein AAGC60_16310 [Acidobacteriota bacterium]